MFETLRDLSHRLAATGYFIDPVMTQVVFLAAKLKNPYSSKDRRARVKPNWPCQWPLRLALTWSGCNATVA